MLDARFLPNPYWVPELRDLTGRDADGQRLRARPARRACRSWRRTPRLINATAPGFEREGKRYLTVAVGCTGGKHRSVAIAEELARRLREARLVRHRAAPRPGARVMRESSRSAAGTGCRASLRALRSAAATDLDITAVVTVADDGGSSGRLRADRGSAAARRPAPGAGRAGRRRDPARGRPPRCSSTGSRGGRTRSAGHPVGNLVLCGLMELLGDPVPRSTTRRGWSTRPAGCCRWPCEPLRIEADVRGADPDRPARCSPCAGSTRWRSRRVRCETVRLTPARPAAVPGGGGGHRGGRLADLRAGLLVHQRDPAPAGARTGRRDRGTARPAGWSRSTWPPSSETGGLSLPDHLAALRRYLPGLRVDVVLADGNAVGDPEPVRRAAESLGARLVLAPVAVAGRHAATRSASLWRPPWCRVLGASRDST